MAFEYSLDVTTGTFVNGLVQDYIYATLIGADGKSSRIQLNELKILPGETRTFTIKTKVSLGKILLVKLEKERFLPLLPDGKWFCSKIVVTTPENEEILFPCYRWISRGEEVELRGGNVSAIKVHQEIYQQLKDHRKKELEKKKKTFEWKEFVKGICHLSNFDEESQIPDGMRFSKTRFADMALLKAGVRYISNRVGSFLPGGSDDWENFENMKLMFPTPVAVYVADHWQEDDFFGYQFLNGINPNVIKKCSKLPRNFPVTPEMVKKSLQGRSLKEEMENGKIFLCDQKLLDGLTQKKTAPLCLFYLNPEDKLMPIAIQLNQAPSEQNPIFLPSDSETDWLLAKIFVKNGDLLLHEAVYHLLATHFLEESFAVATLHNFPPIHPLYKLLMPHFRFTMNINTLARTLLLGPEGIFSESTLGCEGTEALMARAFSEMTYSSLCLPENITARGLDSVPNFYYRDDGLELWNIINSFVEKVVKHYYPLDKDVVDDTELQHWIKDVFTHCFLEKQDFPESFTDVKDVVKFITMIIFTSTAQHAAVNNGQADFALYVANAPLLLRKDPPTTKGQSSIDTILKTLPNKGQTLRFATLATVLSGQYRDRVLVIESPKDLLQEELVKIYIEQFQQALSKLSVEIAHRNCCLQMPYTYLDPAQSVENSVAI